MPEPVSWVRMEADGQAVEGPCLVHGFVAGSTLANDWIDVFDGLDVVSGKWFARLRTLQKVTLPVLFPDPVAFVSGVAVALGSASMQVVVLFVQAE